MPAAELILYSHVESRESRLSSFANTPLLLANISSPLLPSPPLSSQSRITTTITGDLACELKSLSLRFRKRFALHDCIGCCVPRQSTCLRIAALDQATTATGNRSRTERPPLFNSARAQGGPVDLRHCFNGGLDLCSRLKAHNHQFTIQKYAVLLTFFPTYNITIAPSPSFLAAASFSPFESHLRSVRIAHPPQPAPPEPRSNCALPRFSYHCPYSQASSC